MTTDHLSGPDEEKGVSVTLEDAARDLLALRRSVGPKENGRFYLPDSPESRDALEALNQALDAPERSSSPDSIPFTDNDRERLNGIAGELEHLPAEFRRHFDQDGRDAQFLRILASRSSERSSSEPGVEGELSRHVLDTPAASAAGDDPRTAALEREDR